MMTRIQFLFICFFICIQLQAQNVPIIEVPDEIEFADMKLRLSSKARDILQKDITQITKNHKYFHAMVERANLYFPLIEKVFEEESFPKDFKYLALQESSLVSDAVSKSNAVGFWQFKKESAVEVGLRVDSKIDERMNIVSSSRGAARYLRRNNQTYNNWVYSLLSYNLGLGGSKSLVDQAYVGATKMNIDENMHWYVMRFLAHKLVYQHAIGKSASMDSILIAYINGANKTIGDIALENQLDKDKLASYNKWLKTDVIPEDKIYPVVLAVPMSQASAIAKANRIPETTQKENKVKKEKFPAVSEIDFERISSVAYTLVINGVRAILARNGDNSVRLSAKGGISKKKFLLYNEMKSFEEVIPGKIYYLAKKKKKALVMFHTVQYNESLWDIAQNYGMKTETIREKNRMDKNESLDVGRVLWIRSKRPKDKQVEYKTVLKKEVPIEQIEKIIKMDTIAKQKSTPEMIMNNEKYVYHEVVTGETLFGISKKYQIPTDSVMVWNGLENYSVNLGQKLIVGQKVKMVESLYYTVVAGDTFYKIARLYTVSVNDLMLWNNKADMNIKPGDKLIVKKGQP